MKEREKILFYVTVGLMSFALVMTVLNKLIFGPAAAKAAEIARVTGDIEKLNSEIDLGPSYYRKMREWAENSFGPEENRAVELSRAHVISILTAAKLDTRDMDISPGTGRTITKDGSKEISWSVTVPGTLEQLTNLLYLLQNDPAVHRLEAINWRPIARTNTVQIRFNYRTLVLAKLTGTDAPSAKEHLTKLLNLFSLNDEKHAAINPLPAKDGVSPGWSVELRGDEDVIAKFAQRLERDPFLPVVGLEPSSDGEELKFSIVTKTPDYGQIKLDAQVGDEARKSYALIAQRDLFRPYIKRPPVVPPVAGNNPPFNPGNPADPLASLKLVGLPTWKGEDKVVVLDTAAGTTQTFEVGHDLMGGEIVMVDYRAMPRGDKPFLNSPSRVLVRVNRDFWAVELGQFLSMRRKLKIEQLPESIQEDAKALFPQGQPTDEKKKSEPFEAEEGEKPEIELDDKAAPEAEKQETENEPSEEEKCSPPSWGGARGGA